MGHGNCGVALALLKTASYRLVDAHSAYRRRAFQEAGRQTIHRSSYPAWRGYRDPSPHSPRRSWTTVAASMVWALIPLASLGLLAPLPFLFALFRRPTWQVAIPAMGYSSMLFFWMAGSTESDWLLGVLMIVGTAHAFAIRQSVFGIRKESVNERAERIARQRRDMRSRARELAIREPDLAFELGIGRPELKRDYDDGGLVDINHASPTVIAELPGLDGMGAERIVEARRTLGGFVSAEELSAAVDLPPELTAQLKEYTVYLPYLPGSLDSCIAPRAQRRDRGPSSQ